MVTRAISNNTWITATIGTIKALYPSANLDDVEYQLKHECPKEMTGMSKKAEPLETATEPIEIPAEPREEAHQPFPRRLTPDIYEHNVYPNETPQDRR